MGKIKKKDLESMKEVEEPKEQDMNPKDPNYERPKNLRDLKPVKAVLGVLALGAAGSKLMKDKDKLKNIPVPGIIGMGASMGVKKKVADANQKKIKQKTALMNDGGEVEIIRGGDYIKDLID